MSRVHVNIMREKNRMGNDYVYGYVGSGVSVKIL